MPKTISKAEYEASKHSVWNAFIDFIISVNESETNDIQRKVYFCFNYDNEIQNGGHLQYFENTSDYKLEKYKSVVDALKWIGAKEQ
jgi:hypothetical protein